MCPAVNQPIRKPIISTKKIIIDRDIDNFQKRKFISTFVAFCTIKIIARNNNVTPAYKFLFIGSYPDRDYYLF